MAKRYYSSSKRSNREKVAQDRYDIGINNGYGDRNYTSRDRVGGVQDGYTDRAYSSRDGARYQDGDRESRYPAGVQNGYRQGRSDGRTSDDLYIMRDEGFVRDRRHRSMYGLGMIDEDHSAVANLPQGVRMNSYEQTGPWMPDILDDTIRAVDNQMDRDDSQRRRYMNPHKY